jgi:methylated-DNA-[protein]-cysteine S-methyltransferase
VSFTEFKQVETAEVPPLLRNCHLQLQEYFEGRRQEFSVLLDLEGTEFQQRVWKQLETIRFGDTMSYLQQSEELGDLKSIRAVAAANAKNPVAVIIPCHRVLGSDGSLRGYAGGLWRKKWLLDHENPPSQTRLF